MRKGGGWPSTQSETMLGSTPIVLVIPLCQTIKWNNGRNSNAHRSFRDPLEQTTAGLGSSVSPKPMATPLQGSASPSPQIALNLNASCPTSPNAQRASKSDPEEMKCTMSHPACAAPASLPTALTAVFWRDVPPPQQQQLRQRMMRRRKRRAGARVFPEKERAKSLTSSQSSASHGRLPSGDVYTPPRSQQPNIARIVGSNGFTMGARSPSPSHPVHCYAARGCAYIVVGRLQHFLTTGRLSKSLAVLGDWQRLAAQSEQTGEVARHD
jgi:hypothetical protein